MTYSTAEGREPRFVVSEGDSHLKKIEMMLMMMIRMMLIMRILMITYC